MEEESKQDKLTETRGSFEQASYWQRLYGIICPCFFLSKKQEQNHHQFHGGHQETKSSIKEERNLTACFDGIDIKKNSDETNSTMGYRRRKTSLYVSDLNRKRILNIDSNNDFLIKSTIQKWHSYPIYQYYKQKEIVAMGTKNRKLLALIESRRPIPTKSSEIKTKRSVSHMNDFIQNQNSVSNVDKYWGKRYYLFQKFDEGISMDEQSWGNVVPEAVAQYISSKVRCDTVLDAFSGIGGISLKLANTCYRVIANDYDGQKLKCLKRNASVYSAQNIQIKNRNFMQLQNLQPDIIVMHPSININNWENKNITKPEDLNPSLQGIMQTAIKMSHNFVLLLPSNIDPNLLASCIAEAYMNSKINASTCSMKIQKIFFLSKMVYLAVYMGCQVQNQIKLNDELSYIYGLLKDKNDKGKIFHDKRVVKAIRQKHGMINLLNFAIESQNQVEGTPVQKFYKFIRQNKLLDEKKLQKILEEQEKQKTVTQRKIPLIDPSEDQEEQQKYVEDQSIQRTVSYYSTASPNRLSCISANRISIQPRSFISSTSNNNNILQICDGTISDNQQSVHIKQTASDLEDCNSPTKPQQKTKMTKSAFSSNDKKQEHS